MKKKLLTVVLAIICLLSTTNAYAIPKPTSEFYVNDNANLLSKETKSYILNTSVALEKATTAQVVVVTVPSLDGQTIEEYATKLFREYNIGNEKKDNGLLLLLALDERMFRVEVGYGLEEVLPDGLTGRYQDEYIIPYLKEDKWDEGIKNGYTAFVKKLCDFYNVDSLQLEEVVTNTNTDEKLEGQISISMFLGVIFGLIIGIFSMVKPRKTKERKARKIISIIIGSTNTLTAILFAFICGLELLFTFLFSEFMTFILMTALRGRTYFGRGGRYTSGPFGGGSSFGGGGFGGSGGSSGGGGSSRGF